MLDHLARLCERRHVHAEAAHFASERDAIREAIETRGYSEPLGANGLLYRYLDADDGLAGSEMAFGICSFWGVEARALEGDVAAARGDLEHLLSFGNDVGLFAEEIDPGTGAAIGNFPQAFTHVGLINAAITIARLQGEGSVQAPLDASAAASRGHV